MIYVRITEGLGNQFYKYAFAYSISKDIGQKMIIDLAGYRFDHRNFELDKYKIKTRWICLASPQKNNAFGRMLARIKRRLQIGLFYKMVSEDPGSYYRYSPVRCSAKRNMYVQGYWQNYRYFCKYEKEIKEQFKLQDMYDKVRPICDGLASRDTVAVHVRLGDYRKQDRIKKEYYHEAILHIQKLIIDPDIYIFCEEKDLKLACRMFDGYDVKYIPKEYPGLTDVEIFELMRSCRFQIISNSTYSWWAAWLNDYKGKRIVAPLIDRLDRGYYPPEWILIQAEREKEED